MQFEGYTPIKINQEANIHVTEITPGNEVEFTLEDGRQAYLLCIEGRAKVTGEHGEEYLDRHDAAEVFGSNKFTVSTDEQGAHLLLVEMRLTGVGRTDL